jgi:hypothetical protein
MRRLILLLAGAALIVCTVDVWAGGSRTAHNDEGGPTFVISNAL